MIAGACWRAIGATVDDRYVDDRYIGAHCNGALRYCRGGGFGVSWLGGAPMAYTVLPTAPTTIPCCGIATVGNCDQVY